MSEPFDADRARFLLGLLKPERLTRVVDIGANPLEPTPYSGLLSAEGCEVWGFEPQKEAYEELVAAAGPLEHYVPHAVGSKGTKRLNICAESGFTSLLEPNPALPAFTGHFRHGMSVRETVEMDTMPLDGIDLPQPDLIKIDIQGSEVDVFRSGPGIVAGALAVITEVAALPLYQDQPLLDDQMRELRGAGFHLHKFLFLKSVKLRRPAIGGLKRGHRSQLIDGDAVFVRGLMDLEGMDTEALKHIAILADTVFGSVDLAALVVDVLTERGALAAGSSKAYVDVVLNGAPAMGGAA